MVHRVRLSQFVLVISIYFDSRKKVDFVISKAFSRNRTELPISELKIPMSTTARLNGACSNSATYFYITLAFCMIASRN